jgi:hypothetical protein
VELTEVGALAVVDEGVSSTNGSPTPNGERALRDVLEVAAVTTLLKGGTVYALAAGAVPGAGSAAAVFRY